MRTLALAILVWPMLGCDAGKLSKDEAKRLLTSKYYATAEDRTVTCRLDTWFESEGSGIDETFRPGKEHADCVAALAVEKIVQPEKCMNSRTLEVVECPKAEFKLGPKGSKHSAGYVAFECGEKKLNAVTSVATEGSSARVKYTRLVALDDALLGRLSACSLKKPDAGEEEISTTLLRDDDGTWSVEK
ncbi:MAG: hypothetical protein KC731_00125 [Myxococcales bacterium]|nr:hypothetical protein [Myxococcales bacterium]